MPAREHEPLPIWVDPRRYVAHPHLARLADGAWLLVATSAPRRAVTLHPPLDPAFVTVALRSTDEGRSWSEPTPVPATGHAGAECAGLTPLPDGSVLCNQWRYRWYAEGDSPDEPVADARALRAELAASAELDDIADAGIEWSRGGGVATVWRSADQGRSWSDPVVLDVALYSGGYGLRGGVAFPGGEVVLPLCDPPHYARVFLVRSRDGGRSWSPSEPVAAVDGLAFEEPAPLALPGGTLLMLLRENTARVLHAIRSEDRGRTWSLPIATGLAGYPAHPVRLDDGRLAVVTGVRRPRGSIHLALSGDGGRSWERAIDVAGDLDTHDCGYPSAVTTDDGGLFVAYYRRDCDGVTGLHGRRLAATDF